MKRWVSQPLFRSMLPVINTQDSSPLADGVAQLQATLNPAGQPWRSEPSKKVITIRADLEGTTETPVIQKKLAKSSGVA